MSLHQGGFRHVCLAFVFSAIFLGFGTAAAFAAPSFDVTVKDDANEVQQITILADAGQFRLCFEADCTGDLGFNASASVVKAALNDLTSIKAGDGSVDVAKLGNASDPGWYYVYFNGGPLEHTDVEELTAMTGTPPLMGRAARAVVATIDPVGVSRSDGRVEYTAVVKNVGEIVAGSTLTCDPKTWTGTPAPTFAYQWLRNGASLGAANGAQTATYTVQAADQGHSLQCQVTGTNATAAAASVSGPAVASPSPATAPPAPTSPTTAGSRPTIAASPTATENSEQVCTAPAQWSGSPAWTFEWLRNGVPGGGTVTETTATTSKYKVAAADIPGVLQCRVTGTNAGGSAVAISNNKNTSPAPTTPPANAVAQTPGLSGSEWTSGEVTVEVELPGGLETAVVGVSGSGWSCGGLPPEGLQPAKAVCKRSSVLPPGGSYQPIVVAAGLGADAVDPAVAKATVSGGGTLPPPASAQTQFSFDPARVFEITAFETRVPDEAGDEETQAGGHPSLAGVTLGFPRKRLRVPYSPGGQYEVIEGGKTIVVDAPRGFVGNALAIPALCPGQPQVAANTCPPGSAVGAITIEVSGLAPMIIPIYSIMPEFGVPAQFAFAVPTGGGDPLFFTFAPHLRADDGYAITFESAPAAMSPSLLGIPEVTLCSYGARLTGGFFSGCKKAADADANPKPLATLPTRCEGPPPTTVIKVNSWQNPNVFKTSSFTALESTDCDKVPFEPLAEFGPTSKQADSPTGLDVELTLPTEGLEKGFGCHEKQGDLTSPPAAECIAQANLKRTRIYFPEGMGINASAGHNLGSCSAEQVKLGTNDPISCPDSSKIGTIEIDTPLIQETLTGGVYIAKQSDAPAGNLIGLYLVFESKKDGIIIKVPGGVRPDPKTGQLVSTIDEIVEAPFSRVEIQFAQGPRATLITPPKCGTYEVKAEFVPWTINDLNNPTAAETVVDHTTFQVTEGPNGGPCPSYGYEPKLNAGTTNSAAGQHSPFTMRLHRDDGTQRFAGLDLKPPPGLVADLSGVPYCPDAVLAGIPSAVETGQAQIDNPSCPAASLLGTATAGAGAGPTPLFVETGKVYLAGPYKGAPLSLAVVTPAVAGPLDLGNVVIRTALHVDPKTARITAVSDPIPTIVHGVLLDVRDIRVTIDRPNFTLNPTNCEPMSVEASVTSDLGNKANVSDRFQASNCEALGFKPSIQLSLKGGTKRGDNPALKAVVRPRPGDANIARAAVTLPRSAFLDQAHIRTICTRVQFAADNCPKAAIYGRAEAVTPLLDEPLKGPVYLRSSDNELPDLVADLRGPAHQPIKVEAAFRTDSIRGGIRSTLDFAPDAPVTKFTLQMQGGKKGLVVNSQNLCGRVKRANARLVAQNGRHYNPRPKVVATSCNKGRKKAKRK